NLMQIMRFPCQALVRMGLFPRRLGEGDTAGRDGSGLAGSAPPRASAPPSRITAATDSLLDQPVFGESGSANDGGPPGAALRFGLRPDLAGALNQLNSSQRNILQARLPSGSLQELTSLSRETDPELFASGLLQWARREEAADRLDTAALGYGLFAQRDSH